MQILVQLIIIAYIDALYVFFHGDTIVAFIPILRQPWEKSLIITCYQYVHILFVIIIKRTFEGHHFRLEVAQVVDPPWEEANLEVVQVRSLHMPFT